MAVSASGFNEWVVVRLWKWPVAAVLMQHHYGSGITRCPMGIPFRGFPAEQWQFFAGDKEYIKLIYGVVKV